MEHSAEPAAPPIAHPERLSLRLALAKSFERLRGRAWATAPALLLLLALGLRLYGMDWDQGGLFHPDERAVLMHVNDLSFPISDPSSLLDADRSTWNPRWFPYGSFPLYLLKGVQYLVSPLDNVTFLDLRLYGRSLSALADAFTVLIVFLLGLRLYGRRVALLGAAFTALAVIHIQLSHFYASDTFLTLFIALSLLFMARWMAEGSLRSAALTGLFLGLALATKVSVLPILVPLSVAHILYLTGSADKGLPGSRRLLKSALALGVTGVTGLAVVFLAQPYAFLDWGRFLADTNEQREMVFRIRDYPYTRQYIGTTPYWYQIQQLALFGLGLPLGLVAWGGLVFSTAFALLKGHRGDILLLAWVIPYFAITGAFDVKFMRYMLPITPFLLLFGARMLLWSLQWAKTHRQSLEPWVKGALIFTLASTAFYALAYLSMYARPHTAQRASAWLQQQAKPGDVILQEHWEEGVPGLSAFTVRHLPMYEADDTRKVDLLAQELSQAEYILFFSNRLYGTIPRLPERYPLSSRYYQALFSGELGYKLVHWEATYPSLLGVALVDDTFSRPGLPVPEPLGPFRPAPIMFGLGYADESFSVYDHPKVLIFQRTRPLKAEEVKILLTQYPGETTPVVAMLTASEWAAQRAGGTWRDIVRPESFAGHFPVLAWLLLVTAISLASLPLTLALFRPLSDRGYLLGKVLGFLLVAYITWLLASLRWMAFSNASIFLALGLVATVSGLIFWRRREELTAYLRGHWRLITVEEALFLAAFFSFMAIRMANPDLWHPYRGGEKPMDLAYLNAILRSTYMPPYDPWMAGGYINYYYFGQFMVATLIKATGIPTAVAYNLAVPLYFALTFGAAFSIAFNLAYGLLGLSQGRRSWLPAAGIAVAGGLFVVVMGNLDGAGQALQGAWQALIKHQPFPLFDFWRSSRMMPPDPPGFEITEFPFFTFLFADLHAHLLVMPLSLLAMGLSLCLVLYGREKGPWRDYLPTLGLLALAIGSLPVTNTWDLPAYLALALAAILLGEHFRGRGLSVRGAFRFFALAALLVGVAYGLYLPFHQRLESVVTGIVVSETQTAVWQYLAIHGLFVFLSTSLLARLAWEAVGPLGWQRLRPWLRITKPAAMVNIGVLLMAGSIVGLAAASGYVNVALLTALLMGTVFLGMHYLLPTRTSAPYLLIQPWPPPRSRGAGVSSRSPYLVFLLLLLAAALAIGIGVDLVTVKGDISRMNTVFKLYLQGWTLLALTSAGALAVLLSPQPKGVSVAVPPPKSPFRLLLRLGLGTWWTAFTLLVAASLVYPVLGTRARLLDRFQLAPLTLDGTAFMDRAEYRDDRGAALLRWDKEAIEWLQDNVQGSPVILEANTPLYRWGSRISIYTGLPAVVGWDWHQCQQRYGYPNCPAAEERLRDVKTLYATSNTGEAIRLIEKYRVEYIIAGETERNYYGQSGLDKFARGLEGRVSIAYENEGTRVYRVVGDGSR
ncbi:MAG: glycosyltransferase family 39 protein [Chloroflexi bacterium]|nr:glycosyltransferase family 39 protein [Chloroflexota bacterium]